MASLPSKFSLPTITFPLYPAASFLLLWAEDSRDLRLQPRFQAAAEHLGPGCMRFHAAAEPQHRLTDALSRTRGPLAVVWGGPLSAGWERRSLLRRSQRSEWGRRRNTFPLGLDLEVILAPYPISDRHSPETPDLRREGGPCSLSLRIGCRLRRANQSEHAVHGGLPTFRASLVFSDWVNHDAVLPRLRRVGTRCEVSPSPPASFL